MANKTAKKDSTNSSVIQIIGLIVLLIVLICISVGSTLMATGVVDLPDANTQSLTYIYEAEEICDKYIRDEFKERLSAIHVDDFSSRVEESNGVYKMFYEVDIKRDVNNAHGVDKYFLNCFVSGKGRLTYFDFTKDTDFVPKAHKRTSGHPFGL